MTIFFILGTRPEIIKVSPVIKVCDKRKVNYKVVYTDQHYDATLCDQFFADLELREPEFHLNIGSGSHGLQTGKMLIEIEKVLLKENPSLVIVQGDTNSALAGGLVAAKMHIKVGHLEAGLRSYDMRMAEEYNRRVLDHISDYLFAPTHFSKTLLEGENVWGKIYVTGNTVIDACLKHFEIAQRKSKILNQINFKDFILVTCHRAENVDNKETLGNIVEILLNLPYPVVYPIHPRSLNRIKQFGFYDKIVKSENIQLLPPVSYLDILRLMESCKFIITDSGGIQEEATAPIFHKFSFVIRKSTDRQEAVNAGFAKVVGTNTKTVLNAVNNHNFEKLKTQPSPYGNGNASEKILDIISKEKLAK
ncbi:MAG: non-hydrolyzing UDP-N-acetylglucosamine 2-epimerase [Candidatus Helarchaeota archaeon]